MFRFLGWLLWEWGAVRSVQKSALVSPMMHSGRLASEPGQRYNPRPYTAKLGIATELEVAMQLSRTTLLTVFVLALVVALTACSKHEKASSSQQQNPPATSSQPGQGGQSAATAAQPANTNGPRATDKYVLDLTNYAKVPVTIKVNGQWVGQWDNHANIPLDMVVKGENQLTVDLASQPQNTVTVNINTTRDGQGVSILSLNFQGQSGTHTATFVAR